MAKIIFTLEDGFKDGKPIISGGFITEGLEPDDGSGLPALETPSQIVGKTIQRLWDAGVINASVRLAVPDLLHKNMMIEKARADRSAQQSQKAAQLAEVGQPVDDAPAADAPAAGTEQPVPDAPPVDDLA